VETTRTFPTNRRPPFQPIHWLVTIETGLPQLKIKLGQSLLPNKDAPFKGIISLHEDLLDPILHDQTQL
jgi:hypothetical protein